jgi:phosphoglucomutase
MDFMQKYLFWTQNADVKTKSELEAIANNEEEIYARFGAELEFGTAGMRGIIGAGTNRMNRFVVAKATKGYADYINSVSGAAARGMDFITRA